MDENTDHGNASDDSGLRIRPSRAASAAAPKAVLTTPGTSAFPLASRTDFSQFVLLVYTMRNAAIDERIKKQSQAVASRKPIADWPFSRLATPDVSNAHANGRHETSKAAFLSGTTGFCYLFRTSRIVQSIRTNVQFSRLRRFRPTTRRLLQADAYSSHS